VDNPVALESEAAGCGSERLAYLDNAALQYRSSCILILKNLSIIKPPDNRTERFAATAVGRTFENENSHGLYMEMKSCFVENFRSPAGYSIWRLKDEIELQKLARCSK
jgi:hypothetical protein